MNDMDAGRATQVYSGREINWIIKLFLFAIPPTFVAKLFPHGHHILFGSSFILGALLQAIVPPRKSKFFLIFGIAAAGTVLYPLAAYLFGWQ